MSAARPRGALSQQRKQQNTPMLKAAIYTTVDDAAFKTSLNGALVEHCNAAACASSAVALAPRHHV